MAVSKRTRNKAMRIICDFHRKPHGSTYLHPSDLHELGLPRSVGVDEVINILLSKGYINTILPLREKSMCITLTDSGRCYFENQSDERRKFWKEHIVNFVGGFLSGVVTGILLAWLLGILKLPSQ